MKFEKFQPALFEFLEAGDDLDAFLADYPNVRREQALAAMQAAEQRLLSLP